MEALLNSVLSTTSKDGVKPSRWRSIGVNVGVIALILLLYVTRYTEEDGEHPAAAAADTTHAAPDGGDLVSSHPAPARHHATAAPAALAAAVADVDATVDGCPDDKVRTSWEEHCTAQVDGIPRARGSGGGGGSGGGSGSAAAPLVAMLGAPGRDSSKLTTPPHSLPLNAPAHACNLVMLDSGAMLMAWFSGREGQAGVVIALSRFEPAGSEVGLVVTPGCQIGYTDTTILGVIN
jgi:hypothetical protein